MVTNIEYDYIFLLGIVFHITNIFLLGSTAKQTLLSCCWDWPPYAESCPRRLVSGFRSWDVQGGPRVVVV